MLWVTAPFNLFPFLLFADLSARDDEDVGVFLWRASLLALAGWLAPHGFQTT